MSLEKQIDKIDIEKLKGIEAKGPSKHRNETRWKNATIYLDQPYRLTENNALMAMGYEGNGIFMLFLDWDDYKLDETGMFIRKNGGMIGTDFLQEEYNDYDVKIITLDNSQLEPNLNSAISTYAAMSNYLINNGIGLKPVEVRDPTNKFGSRFPQNLLDLTQHYDDVKQQLVEYVKL